MKGVVIDPDDLARGQLICVRWWHSGFAANCPLATPMIVRNILLPFVVVLRLQPGAPQIGVLDVRFCELQYLTREYVDALMPGVLAKVEAQERAAAAAAARAANVAPASTSTSSLLSPGRRPDEPPPGAGIPARC